MSQSRSLPKGIALRVALSRVILWTERAVPAFWPSVLIVAVFMVFSLFGLWPALPGWLHAVLLLIFAGALLFALGQAVVRLQFPTTSEGIRRLERTNNAEHRPVTALVDPPAALISAARLAWSLHLSRTLRRARELRLRGPRNLFGRGDPLALRVGIGMLLLAGFAAFGNETAARVADAFRPDFSGSATMPGTITAWVAPPSYTALPSIPLEAARDQQEVPHVEVPDGSTLLVRVHGGSGESHAALGTSEHLSLVQLDTENAALEIPVGPGGPVVVRQGAQVLARWNFDVRPDTAPEVRFTRPPSGTARGTLQLDVAASDDYGVQMLQTVIDWRGQETVMNQDPIYLSLPITARRSRELEQVTYHDLAAHVWAGEPVHLRLEAADARGQKGSESVETVLPVRRFTHPVAATLVAERKELAFQRRPASDIARTLERIAQDGDAYDNAPRVRKALDESSAILGAESDTGTLGRVIDVLWDTAVWIEEGNFAEAETDFLAAQDELAEALRQEGRPESLEEMLSDLQQNLMEYLEEMENSDPQFQEENTDVSVPGGFDADQNASRRELQDKVDEIVDLAMTGAPEEAEDALDDLREITENMERAGERLLAESEQRLDQRQAMMQQMQEMMQQQEQMMEESFYQSARAGVADQKSPGSGSFDPPEQRQNRLRQELGEMMRRLGDEGEEIPNELGQAEQAMRQAAQELQRNRPGLASDAQGQAIDLLRLGHERLQPMPGGTGPSQVAGEQPGEHNRRARDPFGRVPPGDGSALTGEVGIPTKPERRKAREIVEELRRRAGDAARPELDRDYATRLLDWY